MIPKRLVPYPPLPGFLSSAPVVILNPGFLLHTEELDVLRDTWARYLGYANEVGEACRGVLPLSLVHASYGLVGLYVLADAIHKGRRASHVRSFFLLFSLFFIRHTCAGN